MKRGIIVASFGTSYEKTRRLCIESIENKIKEEFKEDYVIRAFTSQMIIDKLKERDNLHIFNLKEAMEDMKAKEIKDVYIQPLHIIPGHEYEKLLSLGAKVGKPLLYSEEDYKSIVEGLNIGTLDDNEALVFMGHGTDHESDKAYEKLEQFYRSKGMEKVYIGTVEGCKTIDNILDKLKKTNIEKVKLMPFMLVAGDHAINDMASDEDDSWKSILEKNGFQVEISLKGLGEYEIIQDMYLQHLKELMEEI